MKTLENLLSSSTQNLHQLLQDEGLCSLDSELPAISAKVDHHSTSSTKLLHQKRVQQPRLCTSPGSSVATVHAPSSARRLHFYITQAHLHPILPSFSRSRNSGDWDEDEKRCPVEPFSNSTAHRMGNKEREASF
ncbi:hypothetical protein DNTS_034777 [Danionella cerebrum]|uniref:Uncharacterized protein n=1 Tax=Danionella cerebrum TaxID=2873325 RepID=A0A553MXU5_9TELE|nr:hypothetical protein DNTS_034777 [Danionella translucida]